MERELSIDSVESETISNESGDKSDQDETDNDIKKDTKYHKCDKCDRSYKYQHSLKLHISSFHLKERRFECSQCGFRASQASVIKTHIACIHDGKREFKCELCPKTFSVKQLLTSHIKFNHGSGPQHACHLCGKKFRIPKHLREHIVSDHSNVRDFECEFCDIKLATMTKLNQHIKRVHKKNFECSICKHKFGNATHFKSHIKKPHYEKKMVCHSRNNSMKCSYSTWIISYFERHEKTHERITTHCSLCEYKVLSDPFEGKIRLQRHLQHFHKVEPKFDFECKTCKLFFATQQKHRTHIRLTHQDLRPLRCCICGFKITKDMKEKHDFEKSDHMKIHKNDEIKCHICGHKENVYSKLAEHYYKNHEKMYYCQSKICDFVTTSMPSLTHHKMILMHKNVQDEVNNPDIDLENGTYCVLCNFRGESESLISHFKTVHYCNVAFSADNKGVVENITCIPCRRGCGTWDQLRKHLTYKRHRDKFEIFITEEKNRNVTKSIPEKTRNSNNNVPNSTSEVTVNVKINCGMCNYFALRKIDFIKHMELYHNCVMEMLGNFVTYACKTCNFYCYSSYEFSQHILSTGHNVNNNVSNSTSEITVNDKISCGMCNYFALRKIDFIKHMELYHNCVMEMSGNFITYACKTCSFSCYTSYEFSQHILSTGHNVYQSNANEENLLAYDVKQEVDTYVVKREPVTFGYSEATYTVPEFT